MRIRIGRLCGAIGVLVLHTIGASGQAGHAGIAAGVVSSTYSADLGNPDGNPFVSRTGFRAGLDLEMELSKRLALSSGLAYVQKGAGTTQPFYLSEHSGHLELPMAVRIFLPIGMLRGFAEAGGAGALRTSCRSASQSDTLPCLGPRFDVEALLGAGVRVPLKKMVLTASVRRGWGLRNHEDSDTYYIRSRTLAFLLGLGWVW